MCHRGAAEDLERIRAQERDDKAKAAMETAKERGLELPPMVEKKVESGSGTASEMSREDGSGSDGVDDGEVGRGRCGYINRPAEGGRDRQRSV